MTWVEYRVEWFLSPADSWHEFRDLHHCKDDPVGAQVTLEKIREAFPGTTFRLIQSRVTRTEWAEVNVSNTSV